MIGLTKAIRGWRERRPARAAYRRGWQDGKRGIASRSGDYPYRERGQENFAYRVGYTRGCRRRQPLV